MSVKVYCNPLGLMTTKMGWNIANSVGNKIKAVTLGPLFDVYVVNPALMTIGNIANFKQFSKLQKVGACAAIVFGTFYTVMLYGGTIALLGKGIAVLGAAAGLSPMVTVGEAIKNVGKKIFVAGGLPFYGLFYELPKQMIRVAPAVWKAISEKVIIASEWVFKHALLPIWDKALHPAAKAIGNAFQFVGQKIGLALKPVAQAIASVAERFFHSVLAPAYSFVARAIGPTLQVVANAIANAATVVFRTVIAPTGDFMKQYIMKPVGLALCKMGPVFKHVFDTVIVAPAKHVGNGFAILKHSFSKAPAAA